jgi:amino acid permease
MVHPYETLQIFAEIDQWTGLFLGSGTTVARSGPGGAILAYALMGTVISATMSCLGEMTALMPVNAPMMEFPRRFLDRGVGFAVAWMYWSVFWMYRVNVGRANLEQVCLQ